MKTISVSFIGIFSLYSVGISAAEEVNPLKLSIASTVKIVSKIGNSSGTGFFIDNQTVLTCFHVVGKPSMQGGKIQTGIYPDLQIVIPHGETMSASVVSVPTESDLAPANYDFAVVQLASKPAKANPKVELATDSETSDVGDEVIFSGYPLGTPGMVTHRGMVSGFDDSGAAIFVEAPINKGNSGGALLNTKGHAIGIVCNRWGGISKGLSDLDAYITQTESQGGVMLMGVNPLEATKALIETLDTYISTGMGFATSIKFARDYIAKSPQLVK